MRYLPKLGDPLELSEAIIEFEEDGVTVRIEHVKYDPGSSHKKVYLFDADAPANTIN